jgi:hypothetical protein
LLLPSFFAGLSAIDTTPDAVHKNAFRLERMRRFMSVVDDVLTSQGACSIIDVGGTVPYWAATEAIWGSKNISIVIINFAESEGTHPKLTQMIGNACNLQTFPDGAFDLAHSNSVIEHVGRWTDKKKMAREICRVARRYFVQTPAMWFPIEPHYRAPFVHWLPRQIRARLIMRYNMGFYSKAATLDDAMVAVEDAELLSFSEMQSLFPDAMIERERFLGMTKSFIAIR